MTSGVYVNYGCGASVAPGWLNFDASPTLCLENVPFVPRKIFPKGVTYGDIVRGLPLTDASCAGLYASHVLEHLSLEDARLALRNTRRLLAPEGRFRVVVPDLEAAMRDYLADGTQDAAPNFLRATLLGEETRFRGLKAFLRAWLGNAKHLWMWDEASLTAELRAAGFSQVRRCAFNDSADAKFKEIEEAPRFHKALALEAMA